MINAQTVERIILEIQGKPSIKVEHNQEYNDILVEYDYLDGDGQIIKIIDNRFTPEYVEYYLSHNRIDFIHYRDGEVTEAVGLKYIYPFLDKMHPKKVKDRAGRAEWDEDSGLSALFG